MSPTLNIAVAQCPADLEGAEARLSWLEALLGHHGAPDLFLLPELFQCGYNIGARLPARAEAPDGPFAQAVADLAQRHDTAILYGYAERQGDKLFNAAQCITRSGARIGHHRKLLLPPGFGEDHFTPGTGCALFDLGGFRIATLICYDVEFPETVRHVALAGADLVLVPTALAAQWNVVAHRLVPARAFENGVFLCYANYCGHENGIDHLGHSCIIAPDGAELARAGTDAALLTAGLDLAAVATAQARLPYHTDRLRLPWVS